VASLSERLTAILDFDELLLTLVNQVKKSFDYYHAHVYVLDPESQNLVMTAGAGQAGAEMKARGHSIPLNAPTSLVARAARRREIVSVENARQAEDWLPNALLPDTYSEMAIPIILEDAVVGVLDVQQDEIAGLDEGDAGILRALANQVAVAIHNARLFAQTESALAEVQATQQKYLQQAWEEASRGQSRTYRYDRPGLPPISEAARRKARQLAQREQKPALSSLDENQPDKKSLLAPVVLGGATIGTFQLHESEAHVWTEDDLALIEAILDQVAQNAENLRLFDETQERADSERTLREIAEKMRSATSLDRLIKIVTEELGQHLSAEYARIDMGIEAQSTPAEMGVQSGQK
jgi:GAF domain-containing protein